MAGDDQADAGGAPQRPRAGGPFARKLGPLSVGAWVGIGITGVVLGLLLRRSGLFSSPTPAPAASSGPLTLPAGSAVVLGQTAPVTGSNSGNAQAPRDNGEWRRLALERLVAAGQDVIASQQALALFLNGDPVTAQQAALVSMAIRLVGPPPEFVPALNVVPPGGDTGTGTVPPGTVPPAGLGSMSNPALLEAGNRTLLAGQDWRAYETEAVRRVAAGQLSVNDPAWKYPDGGPIDFWWPVARQLFAQGIARW